MTKTASLPLRKYSDHAWREDLRFMVACLIGVHPNLFHAVPEDVFWGEVNRLEREIPHLTDDEVLTGLMGLSALTGDWHTQLISRNLTELWFPIRIRQFEDGLFITATAPDHDHCLGARVLEIGNHPAGTAFEKVQAITAHDNMHSQRYFAPMYLCMPTVLRGLGIIGNENVLSLDLQLRTGECTKMDIPAGAFEADDDLSWYWRTEATPADVCITATTNAHGLPPYWRNTQQNYWFEFLAQYKTVYVGFNFTVDDETERFTDFNRRLWRLVESQDVEQLLIDLRHNLGGDRDILPPLYNAILQHEQLNRKGRLFVLIGPKNVSASSHCAAWFEQNTHAILVGEPTGARPNQYADPEHSRLPNSRLRLMVAKRYWQNVAVGDARLWLEPHILASFRSGDYFGLSDPAMDAIADFAGF